METYVVRRTAKCPFCHSDDPSTVGDASDVLGKRRYVACPHSFHGSIHKDALDEIRRLKELLKAYKYGAAHDSKIIHEQADEIRRLREALEKIKHLVTYPNGIDAYIVADKALKTEEVSDE